MEAEAVFRILLEVEAEVVFRILVEAEAEIRNLMEVEAEADKVEVEVLKAATSIYSYHQA